MATAESRSWARAIATANDGGEAILERQRSRESAARTYARLGLVLVSGEGVHVRDADGRNYLDCLAGAGALALGHHHPVVVAAMQRALAARVPLSTLDVATPLKDRFIEALFDVLPPEFRSGRIQFTSPSGADAVEAALKLARIATGRTGVVAFEGAYHGMTEATRALSGAGLLDASALAVRRVPFPEGPDGWAGLAARAVGGHRAPAAVIVEPVQGEGGVRPLPAGFAVELRRACTAAGVVLIADEVQTGLGRTGALWASERLGLDPDVLVLSKAIGGGLPLAVVVYREELDVWKPGAHAGTFRGNQLAFAAGAAAIRQVAAAGLADHALAQGATLRERLAVATGGIEAVREIRDAGLMVGVELDSGETGRRVQRELLDRGVLVELGGPDDEVVRFLPPLIVETEHVTQISGAFGEALRAALSRG